MCDQTNVTKSESKVLEKYQIAIINILKKKQGTSFKEA